MRDSMSDSMCDSTQTQTQTPLKYIAHYFVWHSFVGVL
jgi:hypothetical protein